LKLEMKTVINFSLEIALVYLPKYILFFQNIIKLLNRFKDNLKQQ